MDTGEYAASIFDSPHRVILAPIIRIPGPGDDMGIASLMFQGWTMSAVVELVSGSPLNAVVSGGMSSTNCGGACGRQRPNKVGAASTSGSDSARVASSGQASARWFNASAFADPGKGVMGSAPRTITEDRGQFRKNIDMVVAKDTEIGAGAVAQVRFELLNLTNTPKFRGINSNAFNSSSFGRITGQSGFMRIWQISFRLTY